MVLNYQLRRTLKIFMNVFACLYVKENSKEILEEISVPSLFRKMQIPAFLLHELQG